MFSGSGNRTFDRWEALSETIIGKRCRKPLSGNFVGNQALVSEPRNNSVCSRFACYGSIGGVQCCGVQCSTGGSIGAL